MNIQFQNNTLYLGTTGAGNTTSAKIVLQSQDTGHVILDALYSDNKISKENLVLLSSKETNSTLPEHLTGKDELRIEQRNCKMFLASIFVSQ